MNQFYKKTVFLTLLLCFFAVNCSSTDTSGQNSVALPCPTTCKACNDLGQCSRCEATDKWHESNCMCGKGFFYDNNSLKCQKCDSLCQTCLDADTCTSCQVQPGLKLNIFTNQCECIKNSYVATEDPNSYCTQCYMFGDKCVKEEDCPEGSKVNKKHKICQVEREQNIENSDKINIIIVGVVIMILQILLAIALYNYLMNRLQEAYEKDKAKQHILNEDEQDYLANQIERERQRAMEEEESRELALYNEKENLRQMQLENELKLRKKKMEIEEKKRQMELEKERYEREQQAALLLKQQQEERERLDLLEKRRLQMEKEAREREEEFRRRQLELEEEDRKRAAEQAILQEQLRKQQEEEDRLRKIREEEERQRLAEEEAERLRLEEEERKRLAAEEEEKERLRQEAIKARNARRTERQLTKQNTMMANESKKRDLREQREKIRREKELIEQEQSNMLNQAEGIEGEFSNMHDQIGQSKQREIEIEQIKQQILATQDELKAKRSVMDEKMDGINLDAAKNSVDKLQQEDIVFISSLKNPPERIRLCMEAVMCLLKNTQKAMSWDEIKKEMQGNFKRFIYGYDIDTMSEKVMNFIQKNYLSSPQWISAKMYKASKAAGVFAEWLESIIQYRNMMMKNKDLFAEVKELELKEVEMQKEIDRIKELEIEAQNQKQKQQEVLQNIDNLKDKQSNLRKTATMKDDDIKFKQQELDALQTNNLDLEEIAEDEDSEDDEVNDILNDL